MWRDDIAPTYTHAFEDGTSNLLMKGDIIRIIKSWRMRWAGHVAHVGDIRNSKKIFVGKAVGKVGVDFNGIMLLQRLIWMSLNVAAKWSTPLVLIRDGVD
jgi:hypothetical protein